MDAPSVVEMDESMLSTAAATAKDDEAMLNERETSDEGGGGETIGDDVLAEVEARVVQSPVVLKWFHRQ